MSHIKCDHFIDNFSTSEKIWNRIGFFGAFIIGAVAVFMESISLGFLYTGFLMIGLFLVARVFFCGYCPYPSRYNTCLFFPLALVKRPKPRAGNKMKTVDISASVIIFGGLILIPQIWLYKHPILIFGFWVLLILVVLKASTHYCKHCRYIQCPLNKVVE